MLTPIFKFREKIDVTKNTYLLERKTDIIFDIKIVSDTRSTCICYPSIRVGGIYFNSKNKIIPLRQLVYHEVKVDIYCLEDFTHIEYYGSNLVDPSVAPNIIIFDDNCLIMRGMMGDMRTEYVKQMSNYGTKIPIFILKKLSTFLFNFSSLFGPTYYEILSRKIFNYGFRPYQEKKSEKELRIIKINNIKVEIENIVKNELFYMKIYRKFRLIICDLSTKFSKYVKCAEEYKKYKEELNNPFLIQVRKCISTCIGSFKN